MARSDDGLDSLREAARVSPDNIPLRQHLADTLLGRGRLEEAQAEYRKALTLAPQSAPLKLGLVRAFFMQSTAKHGASPPLALAREAGGS